MNGEIMEILHPEAWKSPIGYSNGVKVPLTGHAVFIAGQVGWNADQIFESEELLPQFELALKNVLTVLEKAGGEPHHICRMTAYCCDKPQYLLVRRQLGAVWRKLMGKHFPAMSMIFVSDLLDHPGKIELEATAIIAAE
jgi:enamine deaminase RidA (YjgF/YER057c/UK114 family)